MRKVFFITCLFSFLYSGAQVQVYINGGVNNTQIPITNGGFGITANEGGYSWQAGSSIIFPIEIEKKGFFYTGLRYENKNFHETTTECCTLYRDAQYHLQYLSLPMGVGYQLAVSKHTNLRFSGGAYVSMGLTGTAEGSNFFPSWSSVSSYSFKEQVNYNRDEAIFARWNWGLETGISANWKKIALQFHYQFGISNILQPNPDTEMKYRTITLDLGYRLFSSKK